MIRIGSIKAALDEDLSDLKALCARKLRIDAGHIKSVKLSKK
jgi:hypothetical protein